MGNPPFSHFLTSNAHQIQVKPSTHTFSPESLKTSWSNPVQHFAFRKTFKTCWSNPGQQVLFRQIKKSRYSSFLRRRPGRGALGPHFPGPQWPEPTHPSPMATFSPYINHPRSILFFSLPTLQAPRPPTSNLNPVPIASLLLLLASERAQCERAHATYPSPIPTFNPSLHYATLSRPILHA